MATDKADEDARAAPDARYQPGQPRARSSRAGWPRRRRDGRPGRPLVVGGRRQHRACHGHRPRHASPTLQRHPPRRDPHAGEPLVRPLLRHAVGRARLLGPARPDEQDRRARHVPVWDQYGYQPGIGVDPTGYLQPFDLQQQFPTDDGACTNDITHEWGPQHQSWDGGKMDAFVQAHLEADGDAELRGDHGVLRPGRAALLLRAGRRLHHLRRLPLLGARADRPQPRHGAVGHHRPRRHGRRSGARHADHRPAAAVREVLAGPPCPSSCSMRA